MGVHYYMNSTGFTGHASTSNQHQGNNPTDLSLNWTPGVSIAQD